MDLGNLGNRFFKSLGRGLGFCSVAAGVFLCHAAFGQQVTKPLTTLQELQEWVPGQDPWNVSTVPLAPRPEVIGYPAGRLWVKDAPDQSTKGLVFSMHDMGGGYLPNQDAWPEGVPNDKLYTFTEWQYIDTFVYFTHKFVSLPPPGWTNSAHRNGVACLATIITESSTDSAVQEQREAEVDELLSTQETRSLFISKLVQVAKYYKFDGYLVNVEIPLNWDGDSQGAARAANLEMFVARLRAAMKAAIPGSSVVWYDSIIPQNGKIEYQNELNGVNRPYFVRSDGIVTNYFWGQPDQTASPKTSARVAGDARWSVYTGVDVWKREGEDTEQEYYEFDSYQGVGIAVNARTSAGIFAPAWTYETSGTDKSDFPERDHHFWVGTSTDDALPAGGIAQYIAPRSVPSAMPFVTDFNRGFGEAVYSQGAITSDDPWGNVGSVDVLPTWRQTRIPGSSGKFGEGFTTDTAFNGGSSFQFSAMGAGVSEYALFPLFRTFFPGVKTVSYTINKSGQGIDGALVLITAAGNVIELLAAQAPGYPQNVNWGAQGDAQPVMIFPASSVTVNGWETRTYNIAAVHAGRRIVAIGFLPYGTPFAAGDQNLNLGEIQVR